MPQDQLKQSFERLIAGVRKFHTEVYLPKRAMYEQSVAQPQQPHTLIITCADSRIDPRTITQTGPGEVFVTRNIGNLVPAYGEMLGGVSAVIEYAVSALQVSHVVICGHTDCGAMKALMKLEEVESMPTVRAWLRNAEAALSVAKAKAAQTGKSDLLAPLIDENVLLQMNHLRTHPSVAGRLATGDLAVHGWVYDIAAGDVRIYEESRRAFFPVNALV